MLEILYGGSFDPVHNGHLAVARNARDAIAARVLLGVTSRILCRYAIAGPRPGFVQTVTRRPRSVNSRAGWS